MKITPILLVIIISALPIGELRAGIPLGQYLGMSAITAFLWAELANIAIVIILLKTLKPVTTWLMKNFKFFHRFLTKIFESTRKKHSQKIQQAEVVGLITFVAIPLPGTGAWTASLLAFLFDIPFWRALISIFIGNIIAGLLVTAGIGSAIEIIKYFK